MRLGPFCADELADLKFAQAVDHDWADDECGEECGQAGECCTKSQIPKNTEWRKIVEQLQVQQPVEQSASVQSSVVDLQSSDLVVKNRRLRSWIFGRLKLDDRRLLPALVPTLRPVKLLAGPHLPRRFRVPATGPLLRAWLRIQP